MAAMYTTYRIVSGRTGQVYVGVTARSLTHRWRAHQMAAHAGTSPLYAAMRSDGIEQFTIEAIGTAAAHEDAQQLERTLIQQLGAHVSCGGYNLTRGGEVPDEAARSRMSSTRRGKRQRPRSEAFKRAMSAQRKGKGNPMYGKPAPNRRPVIIDGRRHVSIADAAAFHDVTLKTIHNWLTARRAQYAACARTEAMATP